MLNSQILTKLAKKISNDVKGEWLIFGGSSLYLLGVEARSTIDVDIASFKSSTNKETLQLMNIADELALPVETINQAGAFFLNKIENWQSRCRLFHKGKLGKVYIPELDLYIELKSGRMSDTDLSDCLAYVGWTKKMKEAFDADLVVQIIRKAQVGAAAEKKMRLSKLLSEI